MGAACARLVRILTGAPKARPFVGLEGFMIDRSITRASALGSGILLGLVASAHAFECPLSQMSNQPGVIKETPT